MKVKIFILVVILAALTSSASANRGQDYWHSVVKLSYINKVGKECWVGSGVITGQHTILTAGHVSIGFEKMIARCGNDEFNVAAGKEDFDGFDLSELQANKQLCNVINRACPDDRNIGETVYIYGFPGGKPYMVKGKVIGFNKNGRIIIGTQDRKYLKGISGGPVITERGEFIGNITQARRLEDNPQYKHFGYQQIIVAENECLKNIYR